jgi:hypothetical protein
VSHTHRGFLFGRSYAFVAAKLNGWLHHDPIDLLLKRLRAMFPEIVAATSILQTISELAALHWDRTALAKSIFFPDDLMTAASSTKLETMNFLVRAVDRDFTDGRVVVIKGWTLSQTEARLLAFVAADGT